MTNPFQFELYTDGGCSKPDGPGGWGFVLIQHMPDESRTIQRSGGEKSTTNNKMEMTAVIQGLAYAIQLDPMWGIECSNLASELKLVSDSEYIVKGIKEWLPTWKARQWRKSNGKPVMNATYWQQIDKFISAFSKYEVLWVKGHNGHPYNELCDKMATEETEKMKALINGTENMESPVQ